MNPLNLFNGQIPFCRVYLQPPTSRKHVPNDMKDLDNYLNKKKAQQKEKAKSECK